jgi:hypothetical protein
VDSFDLTIQHQFSSKISLEVGGISRWIHNTLLSINLNSVPLHDDPGGQQFQDAYVNLDSPPARRRKGGCAIGFPDPPNCTQGQVTVQNRSRKRISCSFPAPKDEPSWLCAVALRLNLQKFIFIPVKISGK